MPQICFRRHNTWTLISSKIRDVRHFRVSAYEYDYWVLLTIF